MSHPLMSNLGAVMTAKLSVVGEAIAAGTGDNTENTGVAVDRLVESIADGAGSGGKSLAMSCKIVIAAFATLTAGKKATYKATLQDSEVEGSGYADVAAAFQPEGAADSVVITQSATGANQSVYEENINLEALKRYLKLQVHVDCDAGATDTARYTGTIILMGFKQIPVS
jgi:hypothetical protein